MFDLEKLGRLEYWTEETIAKEIEALCEWVQREDSICMAGFHAERSISKRATTYLRDKSSIFREAYDNAAFYVANRLAQKCGGKVHQAVFNKYQAYYDAFLGVHEKEMANAKALSQAQEQDEKAKRAEAMAKDLYNLFPSDEERKIAESKINADAKS